MPVTHAIEPGLRRSGKAKPEIPKQASNILLFAVALHVASAEQTIWVGRIFFIWASVYNLFVVSVFWQLNVDLFNPEQGKRLFGFIAAGATIGALVGSAVTASWTGVNSCDNICEGDHPDTSDARGDARARPMCHLQVFDRRPAGAGACPSCEKPPPARAHHAAGRARADRAAGAVA
jgi:hypothetical protein